MYSEMLMGFLWDMSDGIYFHFHFLCAHVCALKEESLVGVFDLPNLETSLN
jgi:hypothetical protein